MYLFVMYVPLRFQVRTLSQLYSKFIFVATLIFMFCFSDSSWLNVNRDVRIALNMHQYWKKTRIGWCQKMFTWESFEAYNVLKIQLKNNLRRGNKTLTRKWKSWPNFYRGGWRNFGSARGTYDLVEHLKLNLRFTMVNKRASKHFAVEYTPKRIDKLWILLKIASTLCEILKAT